MAMAIGNGSSMTMGCWGFLTLCWACSPLSPTPARAPTVDATAAEATAAGPELTAPAVTELSLSPEEERRLSSGARVERPIAFELRGRRYVGGLAYAVVTASPEQVFQTLNRLDTLAHVLGGTKRITVVGQAGTRVRAELEQGNALVSATYSVMFERAELAAPAGALVVRYWLDESRPHDIQDVWGYFRLTPYPGHRTLVSVGTALDLGPGILQRLFEGRLQRSILRTPRRVREAVEQAPLLRTPTGP